jgi:hypothetical protein
MDIAPPTEFYSVLLYLSVCSGFDLVGESLVDCVNIVQHRYILGKTAVIPYGSTAASDYAS